MPKLPVISGQELIKIPSKAGFAVEGQKGSHVKIKKQAQGKTIVTIVPLHKELDTGTLSEILKQVEISREGFFRLKQGK
ncbi:TPA: type II toxin-antitoxin system HicA family toxin [Candidatus Micrarchaeota archaeon]|nr:type II toxin-antitoxin system HicA family toxin [Candidatus Micrarchaeota archaeon]